MGLDIRVYGVVAVAGGLHSTVASAGPAEETNAVLAAFSTAYSANDIEKLVQLYAPNAILLGTNSPIISEGREEVRAFFTNLKLAGSGNKNAIQERRTIVINDNAVVATGIYHALGSCGGCVRTVSSAAALRASKSNSPSPHA